MNIDDIFMKSFLEEIDSKEEKQKLISQDELAIMEDKKEQLFIIEKFLKKFVDVGTIVEHHDKHNYNTIKRDHIVPQKFSYYYKESTKQYYPGISIMIDHPAVLEIAVPNNPNEGIVVCKSGTHHKDYYLLDHPFFNYENFCKALGQFIFRSTVSIEQDPKKYIKEANHKKQTQIPKDDDELTTKENVSHRQELPYEEPKLKTDNKNPLHKITHLFQKNDDDDD